MAILVLAVATISIDPPTIEATSFSELCERFGVLCEGSPPPPRPPPSGEDPLTVEIISNGIEGVAPATFEFDADITGGTEPYTISWNFGDGSAGSNEQTVQHTFEEAGTYTVTLTVTDDDEQQASDSIEIIVNEPPAGEEGGGADFRAIFLTYVNTDAQRNLYNQELDSSDLIVMHLGLNQAPPTSALDDLDAITSVPDSRKGLEFFSLPEIKKYAPLVAQRGWGFISYDLEGISPDSEKADPVAAVEEAKQYADAAGIDLMVAPSQAIVRSHAAAIAPHVDRFHMQSQAHQDNDSTCTSMQNWINARIASIEGAKPSLADEITAQLTLTRNAAPGKTIYQTAKDCIDKPLTEGDGKADGLSIWFGSTQFTDGTYSQLLKYFEGRYS
ncbi:MAG TPA: PKD domain-containing protein [Nitrososphaera sp.]